MLDSNGGNIEVHKNDKCPIFDLLYAGKANNVNLPFKHDQSVTEFASGKDGGNSFIDIEEFVDMPSTEAIF